MHYNVLLFLEFFEDFSGLHLHKVGAKTEVAFPSKCERIKENGYQIAACMRVCVCSSILFGVSVA